MKVFLIVILCVAGGCAIAWPFVEKVLIRKLYGQSAKPLTGEELKLCGKITKEGRGYPWVCRLSLKHGKCPCMPCNKLDEEKKK